MLDKSNKNVILKIIGLAVAVFLLVYMAITIIGSRDGATIGDRSD